MTYTKFGPFVDNSADKSVNAAFLNAVESELIALDSGSAVGAAPKSIAGVGIDPTGATISTVGVQKFLDNCVDGDIIAVPTGAVIRLDNTLNVTKRTRWTGAGELRWTSGIASAAMINVTVDGCIFDGLYLTNPNKLAAQTGARTRGIYFQASHGKVIGCRIVGQQAAICVEAGGEYHDFVFMGNDIQDVPGSGDGPSSGTGNGEDRGDGIVCWGATATITGNRVNALAGTDARIGIHTEALSPYEATPYVHGDSMVTITGNVVTGQFRRGISSESVTNTIIANNSVADSTWWALSFINTSGCVISDNTVIWTRTSTDNQGSAYSPIRCGIMAYGYGYNNRITGNTVTLAPNGVLSSGIVAQTASNGDQNDLTIDNNTLTGLSCYSGIGINGGSGLYNRIHVTNNRVSGYTNYGIYLYGCGDVICSSNRIDGATGTNTSTGIHAEANASGAKVENNWITYSLTAIQLINRNALTSVCSNTIYQASNGIDLSGTTGAIVNSNLFNAVGNRTINMPSGFIAVGNN